MEQIGKLRKKLESFQEYSVGLAIRAYIHEYQMENYKPKYSTDERINFLNRHKITLEENHPQSMNHPYFYTMFTEITQHIMGDTMCELLDKAIDIEHDLIKG